MRSAGRISMMLGLFAALLGGSNATNETRNIPMRRSFGGGGRVSKRFNMTPAMLKKRKSKKRAYNQARAKHHAANR